MERKGSRAGAARGDLVCAPREPPQLARVRIAEDAEISARALRCAARANHARERRWPLKPLERVEAFRIVPKARDLVRRFALLLCAFNLLKGRGLRRGGPLRELEERRFGLRARERGNRGRGGRALRGGCIV